MTLRHLKVFIKVCEHNSISKAAEELCVAQPSVSQTIKELESYYNVILFNRVNHKLQLTHEGALLLQEAKGVIREFEQFETLARNEDLNPNITIGATMSFGVFIIPKLNQVLREEIPGVNPKFFIDKPAGIEEKIHHGDLDFALCEGVIDSNMVNSTCIGEDELIAICATDYKAPTKLKLEQLSNYNLLLRERGNPSRRILDYQYQIKGLKVPTPLMESVSNNCILSMTKQGQGIAILPSAVARSSLEKGTVRRIALDVSLKRRLFIVTHKEKILNKACKKAYMIAKRMVEEKAPLK